MSLTSPTRSDRRSATISVRLPAPSGAYAGVIALCAVQIWEWGISGLDKLVSPRFFHEFGSYVAAQTGGNLPSLYVGFLRNVVLRAPALFATGSIIVEFGLCLGFLAAAISLLFPRPRTTRLILIAVVAMSLLGAVFAINLAVLNGDPSPWTIGGSPFASGVPVEYLLAGVCLMTAAAALVLFRRTRYLGAMLGRSEHRRAA